MCGLANRTIVAVLIAVLTANIVLTEHVGDRCAYTCYQTQSYRTKCDTWGWTYCTRYRRVSLQCFKDCVHGGWSEWERTLGECSVTCGGGTQEVIETRTCDSPKPSDGGRDCIGIDHRETTQSCQENPCSVHGGWGQWSEWEDTTECDAFCATGYKGQSRSRECNNPEPENGGNDCEGDRTETRSVECNTMSCNELCINDVHYIPHRDITRFWQCSNGVAYSMPCGAGTYWNRNILTCDHMPSE